MAEPQTEAERVLRDLIAEVVESINRVPTYQPSTEWANAVLTAFKQRGGTIAMEPK